jgi:hydrogenase/urease accessory protein HupE
MRTAFMLLTLCGVASAHPNWQQATAEVVATEGKLKVAIRVDIPPYLMDLTAQAAEVKAIDDFFYGDRTLMAKRLAAAPEKFLREFAIKVDGQTLVVEKIIFPTAADVRNQCASQPEEDRYPVMLWIRTETALREGSGNLRIRFPAIIGKTLTKFQTSADRLDIVVVPAGGWSNQVPIVGPTRGFWATFQSFFQSGFEHVIPDGWDHALFMLAMFLSAPTLQMAFLRSLSFTFGHSVTLGLVWYGWLHSPGAWIEPMIAASIVAAGIMAATGKTHSRWALGGSVAFGLLHGLGFAAAADFTQQHSTEVLGALAGFNVGIEIAQLIVISFACVCVLPFSQKEWFENRLRRPLALLTACGGAWLLYERL